MTATMRPPMGGAAPQQQQVPTFDQSTRFTLTPMASIPRPAGGGLSPEVAIPTYGLLAGIWLEIRGTFGGTVGTVNALGQAATVKRVTLRMNNGTVIYSITGPNFQYLFRDTIDANFIDVMGQDTSRNPITASAATLDMVLPLCLNLRDPIGILLLQNRQTTLTLLIEWEADANVTSTGTFTGFQCTPHLLSFSVPPNPASLPQAGLRYVHQVVDESRVIAGAGDVTYDVPKPNLLLRLQHGVGIGASPSDLWSRAKLRVNQSSYIFDYSGPNVQDMQFRYWCGRARPLGVVRFDFLSSSGLGDYGTKRDILDLARLTDIQTVTTVTTNLTFYTVREQLVDLLRA